MTADGNWNLVVHTPMGPREVALEIVTDGAAFTGKGKGVMGEADIAGKVEGDTLIWTTDITTPLPLKLNFAVAFTGNEASGKVKLGMLGDANVTGARA